MNRILLATTALLSGLAASPAFAINDPLQLVISPTRSEVPLSKTSSSVTVITAADIEKRGTPTVTQLLSEVPGVTLANSGGTGQTTRLFMRGTNSNHVLVLIDGMAVNDPSDPATAYDFANISTDNIQRIEVLRGPQSTLYGSQAIGGVVNIITKQGKGEPKYGAFAEYGRYNTSKLGVNSSGEVGRTSYAFSAQKTHTDGISSYNKSRGGIEKDGNDSYTLSANLASKLTDNFTAKLNSRYNRTITDNDSVGSFVRPFDDPEAESDQRQLNLRASGELSLLEGKWVQELGVSTVDFNRDYITEYYDAFFTAFFGRQAYDGSRNMLDWVHTIKLVPNHIITAGVEFAKDSFKANGLAEEEANNKAAFINDHWDITEQAYINLGARRDHHEQFGKEFTWKVAPGYNIDSTGTRLKASYGTGFKAPSLSQLYDPVAGNTSLNPEKTKGWDVGFEQAFWGAKASAGVTYFRNNIEQLIGFGPAPLFATLNVGKARTEGFETTFNATPLDAWTLSASHTYTQSQNRVNDTDLLRRPKHQFNLANFYQYSREGNVGMNIRYSGKSRDADHFTGVTVDKKSYTLVDLMANYDVTPNVTAYGRLENLLDKRYEQIDGFGNAGRGLYVGARLSY